MSFNYEKDSDGIVTVTMDMAGPVNSMGEEFLPLLAETATKLENESGLTGVVLTSAKSTFFAGGDLNLLSQVTDETVEAFYEVIDAIKAQVEKTQVIEY